MDHETQSQESELNLEFDLDDILNEFGSNPVEKTDGSQADLELDTLVQMPELTFTPAEETAPEDLLLEGDTGVLPEVALAGETVTFTPISQEQAAEAKAEMKAEAEAEAETSAEESPVSQDATMRIADLVDFLAEARELDDAKEAAAAPVEEIWEEAIPAPIVFTPKSRLRELKKQLVAGPEKRYYELSEIGTGRLQLAILASLAIVLLCVGATTLFTMNMVPENRLRLIIFSQVLAMMLSALLGSHLMLDALADLFKGRFTVNTMLLLTFAACMADGVFCLMELRVPCCAAFSLEMTMALWARYQRRNTEMAQMDTMRKAVRLHGIIKVEDYFEGKDGILRTEGEVEDFMQSYQKTSSPELAQSIYCALSLAACAGIAGFATFLHGVSLGVQILSTSLLVAVPATFFVATTRPMAILEKRLHMVGTVLCGWDGVKDLCGKAVFPMTDADLFPQGSTKLNGVKFYSDRSSDEAVSYTASLIQHAGGCLVPIFRQLCKSRNTEIYAVENFQNYGEKGIGGEICGEPVLLGTPQFLRDMGVEIPEGTMVSQAIYCSIDGQLCAVYAISYAKMRSAAAGLVTLCGYRKLHLLKIPGDFTLTEDFLRSKFNVRTRRITFLDREAAAALETFQPEPNEPVLAMTTREELVSTAYAITGARALRQSTKLGVLIHLLGGSLGLIIMLVLGYLGSTELLTPTNILLYQLIWAIPGLLITEWTRVV